MLKKICNHTQTHDDGLDLNNIIYIENDLSPSIVHQSYWDVFDT